MVRPLWKGESETAANWPENVRQNQYSKWIKKINIMWSKNFKLPRQTKITFKTKIVIF
jgi:hypothetical protein